MTTTPAPNDDLVLRLNEYVAYFDAVETKPTPHELYYAIKNDGEGTEWRYRATGFGPSDIREAASALEAQSKEIEALRSARDFEQSSRLTSEAQLGTQIENLLRKNAVLKAALEPFVSEAEYYDLDAIPAPIHIDLGCSESREAEYTVADLRRARTALKGAR